MNTDKENVLLNISKPNNYLGPNNNRNWALNGYHILDYIENDKKYLERSIKERKCRLDNWYFIDDDYKEYSIEDYDDYLNGVDIKKIDERIKTRQLTEANNYKLYLESISDRSLITVFSHSLSHKWTTLLVCNLLSYSRVSIKFGSIQLTGKK